jgi:uncharacterized membrane protein
VSTNDSNDACPAAASAPLSHPAPSSVLRPRLEAIDALRGLVIILMALDHTRDFFHWGVFANLNPLDLKTTTPALFLTRWITHFCAPLFVFLAGTGSFMAAGRGKFRAQLSSFLLTRGLWLVVLEVTWIRCLGWSFNFDFSTVWLAVIWAIGISMVVLAGLIYLPLPLIAAFGLVLIAGHNAWDGWDEMVKQPNGLGTALWQVLHAGGKVQVSPGFTIGVSYPLVPWIGVMALGYAFGTLWHLPPGQRQWVMVGAGVTAMLLFALLRGTNLYGDTHPWTKQGTTWQTLLAILDCRKYPPSLAYLLMTLGPAWVILSLLDRGVPRILEAVLVFGRVPLFFYLLHLPVIHGLSVVVHRWRFEDVRWLFSVKGAPVPPGAGFSLLWTYVAWAVVLALLYPLCRWFATLKRRRKDTWWLSYL